MKCKWLLVSCVLSVAFFAIVETTLRVALHAPSGLFLYLLSNDCGLYVPNAVMTVHYGPFPYVITTNSLGMRSRDIEMQKPKNSVRIMCVGDSITDGFFIDNEDTYPMLLEKELLQNQYNVQVLNAARGGCSIDRQYAVYRKLGKRLNPDMVILTFVTNDISDLRNTSKDGLLDYQLRMRAADRLLLLFAAKTAMGEMLLDTAFRIRFKNYRAFDKHTDKNVRYRIDGNSNYRDNVKIFNRRFGKTDGMVLSEPFSDETVTLIDNYLFVLKKMAGNIQQQGKTFVFVYFPSYSQLYDENTSVKIRDVLKQNCAALNVPFLDLTPAFKQNGSRYPLHLAPADFHPNPRGNGVMARAVYDFIIDKM